MLMIFPFFTISSNEAVAYVFSHLDKSTIPQKHVSPFRSRQHFPVRKLHVAFDVRYFSLAKLSQFSLKFETSKRACHLPKPKIVKQNYFKENFKEICVSIIIEELCYPALWIIYTLVFCK